MDPASAAFQRVFDNPFAYAAFKSTEPWLLVRPLTRATSKPSAAQSACRMAEQAALPGLAGSIARETHS